MDPSAANSYGDGVALSRWLGRPLSSDRLLRVVSLRSNYGMLPLFAFANAGVVLSITVIESREPPVAGIVAGLVAGKPLGIPPLAVA